MYAANFLRVYPQGASDPGWIAAKPTIELIAAAMEPITVDMIETLLHWTPEKKAQVLELTGLLFPVRARPCSSRTGSIRESVRPCAPGRDALMCCVRASRCARASSTSSTRPSSTG